MSSQREMTLEEWVARLPDSHLAAKQYREQQARADLAAEREAELVDMLRECMSYMINDHDAQATRVAANDLLISLGEK